MPKNFKLPWVVWATVWMLFIWLGYTMLTEFRNYLYPLFLGGLFAYLLYPLANFLEKKGIPRILSNIFSILVGLVIVSGVSFVIYKQVTLFLQDIPQMQANVSHNINQIFKHLNEATGIQSTDLKNSVKQMTSNVLDLSGANLKSTFTHTFQTVFTIGIMPVYVFFLLYYRNKFREVLLMLISSQKHKIATRIIDDINQLVVYYMTGVFKVVTILAIVNSLGFFIIGIKHALFLGILAALMNFIPYYGTIIGYFFPLFIALFTMNSPMYAFWVVVQFALVQFTENNILTPNIVGSHVKLNPFMIILAITLGGFVWGLPGMFIAVPMAAVIRVLGENVPALEPVGYLLGSSGTEEHSITSEKISRFFKRIFKK
ncbi:MAG: AI-2E family transporter [Bacteroidales bacterium]|nr:AI-2E family transporter [Bacteroidales bacterium]